MPFDVAGKIPGAKPGHGVAVQAHLDDAKEALEAVHAAKVARDMKAEKGALHVWMSAIVSANHLLYGACPPLLVDVEVGGLSASLLTPRPSLEAGVGCWKDYVNEIKERFEMQLALYVGYGLVRKENFQKIVDDAYDQRDLMFRKLLVLSAFYLNLGFAISPAALKKPVSTRTSIVVRVLEVVLDQVSAHHGEVWEIHSNAVKHWLFLLGELGRRLSHEGCVCQVVGTDRPFERKRKWHGD
ncbi:hypothetical protein B0H14DRAFT_3628887 [Mycena olivaceomarginata]|nr:hypothetical protein B0H14DRAFT_3628887 [Mycena olivaceomarginata]